MRTVGLQYSRGCAQLPAAYSECIKNILFFTVSIIEPIPSMHINKIHTIQYVYAIA